MIDRPNIPWILSDEHRPDSLGCYGSPWAIIWAQYQRPQAGPRRTGMRVAIRTERYRMDVTWWRDGRRTAMAEADGNLFDLREDAGETVNRWSLPTAQAVIADLWRAPEAWDAGLERPTKLFSETND